MADKLPPKPPSFNLALPPEAERIAREVAENAERFARPAREAFERLAMLGAGMHTSLEASGVFSAMDDIEKTLANLRLFDERQRLEQQRQADLVRDLWIRAQLEPVQALPIRMLEARSDAVEPTKSPTAKPMTSEAPSTAPASAESGREDWTYGWAAIQRQLRLRCTRQNVMKRVRAAARRGGLTIESGDFYGQAEHVRVRTADLLKLREHWRLQRKRKRPM